MDFKKPVIVRYTDDITGLAWSVAVSRDTIADDYDTGIRLGPPDLQGLNLPDADMKRLRVILVDQGWYNADTLCGHRADLRSILKKSGFDEGLERHITSLYQTSYYEE